MRCIQGIAFVLLFASTAAPQSTCPPLQAPTQNQEKLLFTPQQEMELGDIIGRQVDREFRVMDDDAIVGMLRQVGARVAAQMPNTGLQYQFFLYDQPEIQAFSMPGGRIYVSRKMVAFLRNEDELAGLLGHEMGHLAARQQALDLSHEFRDVLGMKTVAPDEDLYERYNQYVETIRLRKKYTRTNEDDNQKVADSLGVQAVVRAGYKPQAFPDLLDRLMETKGKTGSWFSDLFGATRPSAKRLREALKDVANLPVACIDAKAATRPEDFSQWQAAVLHYRGIGHGEKLTGVVARKKLQDPLRGDVRVFHFSHDGKYILAQDDGGISVLSRDPLQIIFRIDAEDAEPAQFSSDSRQVQFFSNTFRVETWDIARQEQVNVQDVPVRTGCKQTRLSPNAKYLACFTPSYSLNLYEVASGEEIFKKDAFFDFEGGLSGWDGLLKFFFAMTHPILTNLQFSPDELYFAACSRTHEEVVFDLTARKKISVPGSVQKAISHTFTFVGPHQILGLDFDNQGKSPLVEFPSGKILDHYPLGGDDLETASNPQYVLVRPVVDRPVGILDLQQKKMLASNRNSATDVWGDFMVSERLSGEIGLYKIASPGDPLAKLQLPLGGLGRLQTFALSPDLRYLAISSETRGGVWDLEHNQRNFLVRNFQAAYYATNSYWYLDMPKFEKFDREMVVMSPVTKQAKERVVDEKDDASFFGSVYLKTVHDDKNKNGFELQGLDMITLKPLWSRKFLKGGPKVTGSVAAGKLVLTWFPKNAGLHEELATSEKFAPFLKKENLADSDYFIEILNISDGTVAGGVAIRTGKDSFRLDEKQAAGDWLAVTDDHNRTLLYSISTGQRRAKWFGTRPQFSRNGDRLCLVNGRGKLSLYDLHSMKMTGDLTFANRISAAGFSADGNKLFVMTSDQSTFILDATGAAAVAATQQ